MNIIKIRSIIQEDNIAVAELIRNVLVEMGVPKVGTAYEDTALDMMYETYNVSKKMYFVAEDDGEIVGGAGIAPLEHGSPDICELQKMYFIPKMRGKGMGFQMMQKCLDFAKEQGFSKCYLETMSYMKEAKQLYNKVGFKSLDAPLGDTGHYSCQAWMIKEL